MRFLNRDKIAIHDPFLFKREARPGCRAALRVLCCGVMCCAVMCCAVHALLRCEVQCTLGRRPKSRPCCAEPSSPCRGCLFPFMGMIQTVSEYSPLRRSRG